MLGEELDEAQSLSLYSPGLFNGRARHLLSLAPSVKLGTESHSTYLRALWEDQLGNDRTQDSMKHKVLVTSFP